MLVLDLSLSRLERSNLVLVFVLVVVSFLIFLSSYRFSASVSLQVADRTAATLEQQIQLWILPGTHIVLDGWRAYRNINTINNGVYTHAVINHSENFVDPDDAETQTQSVENFWMRAKRKLRRQCGTSEALFPSYLSEFMYGNRLRDLGVFTEFIISVARQYPV